MQKIICRKYIFSGRVQGVGFRYTANSIARGYDVAGYVKNLPDGTVEIVCQGTEKEIASYITEVRENMDRCIYDENSFSMPVDENRTRFEIDY
jgi:acylphosphatase